MNRLDALATAGYDQVFLPVPSHHQDHQIVYQVGFAALRPRGSPGPSLVAAYEYPYVGWAPEEPRGGRWYVDISGTLDRKKAALAAYRTQAASPPHPLSWEAVETLARQRGFESGFRHAELFHVLRMTDPSR
jgi:LmbE family N-acetylglucosaminyl deacetylase